MEAKRATAGHVGWAAYPQALAVRRSACPNIQWHSYSSFCRTLRSSQAHEGGPAKHAHSHAQVHTREIGAWTGEVRQVEPPSTLFIFPTDPYPGSPAPIRPAP